MHVYIRYNISCWDIWYDIISSKFWRYLIWYHIPFWPKLAYHIYVFLDLSCVVVSTSHKGFFGVFYEILLIIYAVFYSLWHMDQSVLQFFGKCYDVLCSKIPELLCHTFPTLHRINCQGTCYSKYSICKIFWRYTNSKKDMDIDMMWYNILMIFWDRGHDIISQQLARYEIWYYILEFGIFPTTG